MRKFLVLIIFVFSVMSFGFTYQLTQQDESLVETLTQKVEDVISQRGEEVRLPFISALRKYSSKYEINNVKYAVIFSNIADNLEKLNNHVCIDLGEIGPNGSISPLDDPNVDRVCCEGLTLVSPIKAYDEQGNMGEGFGTICADISDGYCDARYENKWNSKDCRDDELNDISKLFLESGEFSISHDGNYIASIKIQNNDIDLPINGTVIEGGYHTFYKENEINIECKLQNSDLFNFVVLPLDNIIAGESIYAEGNIDNTTTNLIQSSNDSEIMCHINGDSGWNIVQVVKD